jgi:hypothetical protein
MSRSQGSPVIIGDNNLNDMIYLGLSLMGFGLVFFLYLIVSDKSKPDDEGEIE